MRLLARCAEWRARNRARVKAYNALWRSRNGERHAALSAAWRAANSERAKRTSREWQKKNQPRRSSTQRLRQAGLKRATPPWADLFLIEEAYRLATLRSKVTGIKWHVDHDIPLKHPLVCGLHWHQNLNVIPAAVNVRKRNKFDPETYRGA